LAAEPASRHLESDSRIVGLQELDRRLVVATLEFNLYVVCSESSSQIGLSADQEIVGHRTETVTRSIGHGSERSALPLWVLDIGGEMVNHGILVMEGDWSRSKQDVRTVRPMLDLLRHSEETYSKFRTVDDSADFEKSMLMLGRSRFTVGYVALHGSPGAVYAGVDEIRLSDLPRILKDADLRRKVLHFGSCSTLRVDKTELLSLKDQLGVRALTGFTEDVDFIDSIGFETLLFSALTRMHARDAKAFVTEKMGALGDELGFVWI